MAGKKQNPRKASGSGPAAIQKEERVRKVRKLLKWVFPLLDVEKIEQSGDIWPRGNLKKNEMQPDCSTHGSTNVQGGGSHMLSESAYARGLWKSLDFNPLVIRSLLTKPIYAAKRPD